MNKILGNQMKGGVWEILEVTKLPAHATKAFISAI
jgi:hypothetical protein